jgi:hypothetical protein
MLPESDRKDLAIQALARSTTISDLSVRHRVSRKFVYQQAHVAGVELVERLAQLVAVGLGPARCLAEHLLASSLGQLTGLRLNALAVR